MKKPTFDSWIFSLPISLTFPPFLYLYSKYVTIDFERFQRKDDLHATPVIITVLLIFLFRSPERKDFYAAIVYYAQLTWLSNYIGGIFILMLWIYGILFAIKNKLSISILINLIALV